ncbi:MAG: hypothetical protein AAFN74_15430, partial [Myxococcota bacterium]
TAIVPLVAVNLSADEIDVLTERLATALSIGRTPPVRGGRLVRRLLPEEQLPADCAISASCQARVRKVLEAERLIFVVATRIGDTIQLDPTVVTRTGTESRPAIRGHAKEMEGTDWWAQQTSHLLPVAATAPIPTGPPIVSQKESPRWPVWALAGTTVASLGVGIGFGLAAQSAADDLEARGCPAPACSDADIDSAAQKATIADIMYVTSGVTAVATVLMFLYLDEPSPIAVGAGPSSVSVSARF